jgi:hypothetical protein
MEDKLEKSPKEVVEGDAWGSAASRSYALHGIAAALRRQLSDVSGSQRRMYRGGAPAPLPGKERTERPLYQDGPFIHFCARLGSKTA